MTIGAVRQITRCAIREAARAGDDAYTFQAALDRGLGI